MLRLPLYLLVGVCVWGFMSCSIICPDEEVCSDLETCCNTLHGYSCCPYPKAVCCSDLAHCCPSGFICNFDTHQCEKPSQPWFNVPMVKKEEAEESIAPIPIVSSVQELRKSLVPGARKSSVVNCDNDYTCPDGTTCCRHREGSWFCCPSSATQGMALSRARERTSKAEVIRCDSTFYCPEGTSCCKGPQGQWNCCPYPLGQCCSDGRHCCQYGYTCTTSSMSCYKSFSQVPSAAQERAKSD